MHRHWLYLLREKQELVSHLGRAVVYVHSAEFLLSSPLSFSFLCFLFNAFDMATTKDEEELHDVLSIIWLVDFFRVIVLSRLSLSLALLLHFLVHLFSFSL